MNVQDKPFTCKCFVRGHVANQDFFFEKDVAISYANHMPGQWTNNTPDRQMHQFTRITVEETATGRMVLEISIGLYDQGHPPTNAVYLTAFFLPEHLNARLQFLATDSFHLFVNGHWLYTYRLPEHLLQAYHEFERQGQACTVVAAGEIFFYCRRAGEHEARS